MHIHSLFPVMYGHGLQKLGVGVRVFTIHNYFKKGGFRGSKDLPKPEFEE